MEPTILTRNNKKRGLITQSLYFRTLAMPCLNYFYDLFYKDKIKLKDIVGPYMDKSMLYKI